MAAVNLVIKEFGSAFLPLSRLDSVDAATGLLADLGWEFSAIGQLSSDWQAIGDLVDEVRGAIEATEGGHGDPVDVVIGLLDDLAGLVAAAADLLDDIESAIGSNAIDESGIRQVFVRRLVDYLVIIHLGRRRPGFLGIAANLGVVEQVPTEANPAIHQPEFVLRIVHWDRLPMLLSDPMSLFDLVYDWDTAAPDIDMMVGQLDRLVRSFRLPGALRDQDPELAAALGRTAIEDDPQELRIPIEQFGFWPDDYAEAGLGVSPLLPGTPDGAGLALVPYAFGNWQTDRDLGSGWSLEIDTELDAGIGPALIIHPPLNLDLYADLVAGDTSGAFRFAITLRKIDPDGAKMVLFGRDGGSRLDLGSIELAAAVEQDNSGGTVDVTLALNDLSLVLGTGGADTFARQVLPDSDIESDFDLTIGWSSDIGFHFQGGARFDITIPVFRTIGPITVEVLHLTAGVDQDGFLDLDVTADLTAELLIFAVGVDRFGLRSNLDVSESGGSLGPLGIGFGLAPPSRIDFQITTETITGGGFVEYFEDTGRYLGGLTLDVVSVGIDAFVIVDTRLPGDPSGWAFYASLTATFPGIPIGFGFTLEGIGGLLALNRSLDAEALASGLRSGAVDALLFPDDPVNNSLELAAQIDEYFPLTDGNTVVGPVIQIGWGSPKSITAQLGIVISFPDGLIAVMGSVAATLPTPDEPLLTLNMDALGVVDIAAGTFSLTASLYDSRLLETIDLGGDMAMFLSVGRQPYFLLSVGGFHPGFEPPSVVPAHMHDLRRMFASIDVADNVFVGVESYFAVTSNSLQFGSAVNMEAIVKVGLATYSARGWFSFDVLLQFSPFRIMASMAAGVGVYSGDRELMGVSLTFMLEGPDPWAAVGTASFKFFGLKVNFAFDVGMGAGSEPRPIARPLDDAIAALQSVSAWRESAPVAGLAAGLIYEGSAGGADDDGAGDVVWIRPDHNLEARQSVAPLERTLELVGQAVPAAGQDLLTVTDYGIGATSFVDGDRTYANDWFAPAQFEDLGTSERLSRSSFEEMKAGVTFGSDEIAVPVEASTSSVTTDYEEGTLENSIGTGAFAAGLARMKSSFEPLLVVEPTTYTVARADNGWEATQILDRNNVPAGGVDQYNALAALRSGADSTAGRFVVVPATSVLERGD